MGKNLVIVAIPEEQDRVWKISSEKIPHLTLLFLGDAENNPDVQSIMQFVEHATEVSEHGQFYLDVDRRGTLGADDADVVFFNNRSGNLRWIKQFRSQLLQNQQIRKAYDSTEQFEEWHPHLTLGYPATPAKELKDNDHPIYSVCFDRIAVWMGDFDGPEFRLEWPERDENDYPSVAYSDVGKSVVDRLLHVGVKGMRWGQRKTTPVTVNGKSKMVTPKKAGKLDAKWAKNQFTLPKGIERHNAMADHFNARIGGVNDKYAKDDFSKEHHDTPAQWTPKYKSYMKEIGSLQEASFRHAVTQVHGTSPTGKQKAVVEGNQDTLQVVIKNVDVQHAVTGDEVFVFTITRNDKGLIIKADPTENGLAQTAILGEEFVEHHGVKGMHWGQRKERLVSGARSAGRGMKRVASNVYFETDWAKDNATSRVTSAASKNWAEKDVPRLNAQYKGTKAAGMKSRLKNPLDPKTIEYRGRSRAAFRDRINEEVAKLPTNKAGTRKYEIHDNGKTNANYMWSLKAVDVKRSSGLDHAATDPMDELLDFSIQLTFDTDGFIIGFTQVPETLAQDGLHDSEAMAHMASAGAEFIEHYGIKGMHWGQRNRTGAPTAVAPTATSRVPAGSARKTKIDVSGGENHPAHPDAIKVAQAKIKLAKSGTSALSNQELRDVAARVQLETQVKQLTMPKGKKFVTNLLKNQGNQQANQYVSAKIRKKTGV